jgi:hypothetical protein
MSTEEIIVVETTAVAITVAIADISITVVADIILRLR